MVATGDASSGTGRLERLIEERVAAGAPTWFPEREAAVRPVATVLSARPRCALFVVGLDGPGSSPEIVAKVRRGEPSWATGRPRGQRPRLAPTAGTVQELTSLEYEGLAATYQALGGGQVSALGAVRPLEHVPAESMLLMEHVPSPTLRDGFVAESRLATAWRSRRQAAPDPRAWYNAGAWLRAYHRLTFAPARPVRQPGRDDVVERLQAYGDYLSERLGTTSVGGLARDGTHLAAQLLPERFPLVVGHGDFVARNVFVEAAARVRVFDPMPRWQVPWLEDVCRFVVGLRMSGLQAHTYGAAYAAHELDRRERTFLAGYHDDGEVPRPQLGCYQLLVTLDKWSALVDTVAGRGAWPRARAFAAWPAQHWFRREAQRLVRLLKGSQPVPSPGGE